MLRPASAALLMAVTLALPPGLARAAQYDDGLTPPGSVGPDQTYQDQTYQDSQPYPAQRPQDGYGRQDDGQVTSGQTNDGQVNDGQVNDGQVSDSQAGDDQQPAGQQDYGRAPATQPDYGQARPQQPQGGYVVAQDSTMGDLLVRVQRLEGDNRRLNGTIEDLQSQIRKLQDDMKRQQDDTEYRLQALEGGGGGGTKAPAPKPATPQKQRSGQNSQGTPPQTLGSIPSNNQDDVAMQDQTGDDQPAAPPPPRQQRLNSPTTAQGLPGIAVDTSRPLASNAPDAGMDAAPAAPATPEDEYTADYRLIESQKYDQAEAAFRSFVTAHPKDKRVPDAIHWIGESLYQRKQYTDAAEQFLKVTKTYASSRRAPSSMLKLGITLAAMGEKDAACAALQAVASKYPKAGTTILSGADREIKKNACTAG
jgi:tol-pal system protein YbgF